MLISKKKYRADLRKADSQGHSRGFYRGVLEERLKREREVRKTPIGGIPHEITDAFREER